MAEDHRSAWTLPAIVLAVLASSSVWFAANAILGDLPREWDVREAIGWLTSGVQLGFITGTLILALSGLADRYSPRLVYLVSSIGAAACTLGLLAGDLGFGALLASRFGTGLFLAGVYPIAMKIAAGWYREGLGAAIGWLVGALVVGTALPHLLRGVGADLAWQSVVYGSAAIGGIGGVLMFALVPDGPFLTAGRPFDSDAMRKVFGIRDFRAAALGYFGHMWELYTLWALTPLALATWATRHHVALSVPLWSFAVIGIGAVGCVGGGALTGRFGSGPVASVQLVASAICCLIFPLMLAMPGAVFLTYLLVWGIVVVGDSPQFSTLNAQSAPPHLLGSGLTIVTSIGFAVTVVSLQLASWIGSVEWVMPVLAIGPILGLVAMRPHWRS